MDKIEKPGGTVEGQEAQPPACECGGKVTWDKGEPMTRNQPGYPAKWMCEDCGCEVPTPQPPGVSGGETVLLPCPGCGQEPRLIDWDVTEDDWRKPFTNIFCQTQGCIHSVSGSREWVIAAWNALRRVPAAGESAPPLVYLASPYSHPDPAVRERRFADACKTTTKLIEAGEMIFSPIVHSHPLVEHGAGTDWQTWQRYDRAMIDYCGEVRVLMLDGWQESVGVQAEIAYATEKGKKITLLAVPAPAEPGNGGEK